MAELYKNSLKESKFFKLNRLKRIIIIIFFSILIFLSLIISYYLIIDFQRSNILHWYRDYKIIQFTSYVKPYSNTFFCSLKLNFAYDNEKIKDEFINSEDKILDIIRQTVSEQDYYKINTDTKRHYNLTPVLINRLNMFLKFGRIKDVTYPRFLLMKKDENFGEYKSITYLDMGSNEIMINNRNYYFEFYIIFENDSPRFNEIVKKNISNFKQVIISYLNINKISYLRETNILKAKQNITLLISNKASDFMINLSNIIKRKYPLFNEENRYKGVLLSLFYKKN